MGSVDRSTDRGRAYLEVFRNYLTGVAEETWVSFRRSAYSLNIKERGDCTSAVFTAEGEVLAVPPQGVPLLQGSLEGLVTEVRRLIGTETIDSGDVFITNDPYIGGGHANDYCCVAPIFSPDGEVIAYVANTGHHTDIGGRVPCSIAADNQSIFEEGVLIPPVRLVRAGEVSQEVVAVICRNSRSPEERRGDLSAHLASIRSGVERLESLATRLGTETFLLHSAQMLDYSEARLREVLASIPDGTWQAEDALDSDGRTSGRVPLPLTLTKSGPRLEFDWTQVPDQRRSGRNIPVSSLRATCFTVVRGLVDPGMHVNGGLNRLIDFRTRPGSVVHAVAPAAVSDRATPCQVVADVAAACLSQMLPERALAASGTAQGWAFGGTDPRTGRTYANYETVAGGIGATSFADGMDGVRGWPSGSMNPPIEALEQEMPFVVRRYEFRENSGGAGRFRGGLGLRRDIEIRSHDTDVTVYSMRHLVPARGLAEGHAGAVARFTMNPGTEDEEELPATFTNLRVPYGAVLRCETPGGGGYGRPADRSPEMAREDAVLGLVRSADEKPAPALVADDRS